MAPRSFLLDEPLAAYLAAHAAPTDPVVDRLITETRALGDPAGMQIGPDQYAFMSLLTALIGARDALEIGTFTGLSALAVARALAPGGRLLCCDVSEEWTTIARRSWAEAGVDDRIELRIGPAAETVGAFPEAPQWDLAFIDADKTGYLTYWELVVPRIRPNGLILVDNVLRGGRVADPANHDEDTTAIRAFNDRVAGDHRVQAVLLPVADGLTVARRLPDAA